MRPKLKTHFEQVPLEIVKKIIEKEAAQEQTIEQAQGTKKKNPEEDLLAARTFTRRRRRS